MAFTYDGVGNRVTYGVNPGAGLMTDIYAYPATSNRLSTISLGAGGNRAFTYDAAGNVTYDDRTGGGYGYTYDAAGRMATFSINGVLQASYKYDFAGRQVVRALSSGAVIHSVFDADGNRIAEYDQTSGALIREYVWFDGAAVAVIEGGVVYYIRTDHIGRPVFATNAAGVLVWTASYLPFGGVRTATGMPITLRFPGQWFQSESGLHQNWMRDYDPTTGRYIQADPLGLVDGASVYGYVKGNPGRWIDPRGEEKRPYVLPQSPAFLGPDWQPVPSSTGGNLYECSCSEEKLRYDNFNSAGKELPHWHYYPYGNLKKTGQYSTPETGPHLPPGTTIMVENCDPQGSGAAIGLGVILMGLNPPWERFRRSIGDDLILE